MPDAQDTIPASAASHPPQFAFSTSDHPPAGVVVWQFPHSFTTLDKADLTKIEPVARRVVAMASPEAQPDTPVGCDPLPRSRQDQAIRAAAILGAFRDGRFRAEWLTGDRWSRAHHSEPVTAAAVDWAAGILAEMVDGLRTLREADIHIVFGEDAP